MSTDRVIAKRKRSDVSSSENEVKSSVDRIYFSSNTEFKNFKDNCSDRDVIAGRIFPEEILKKIDFPHLKQLKAWGWWPFICWESVVYANMVRTFYFNGVKQGDKFVTKVCNLKLAITEDCIKAALGNQFVQSDIKAVPEDFNYIEACRRIYENPNLQSIERSATNLPFYTRVLHLIVCQVLNPKARKSSETNNKDIYLLDKILKGEPVNLPAFILGHMLDAVKHSKETTRQALPYGKLASAIIATAIKVNEAEIVVTHYVSPLNERSIQNLEWIRDPNTRAWVRSPKKKNTRPPAVEQVGNGAQNQAEQEVAAAGNNEVVARLDGLEASFNGFNQGLQLILQRLQHNHDNLTNLRSFLNVPTFAPPFPPHNP